MHGARVPVIQGKGQANVFFNGQSVQQVKVLEYKTQAFPAETGQFLLGKLCQIRSVQQNLSCAYGINGGDAVEQGGFAAAGPRLWLPDFDCRNIFRCSVLAACEYLLLFPNNVLSLPVNIAYCKGKGKW